MELYNSIDVKSLFKNIDFFPLILYSIYNKSHNYYKWTKQGISKTLLPKYSTLSIQISLNCTIYSLNIFINSLMMSKYQLLSFKHLFLPKIIKILLHMLELQAISLCFFDFMTIFQDNLPDKVNNLLQEFT